MQALHSLTGIERGNIQPQLDALFGPYGLPAGQFDHAQVLAEQLRGNGNTTFLKGKPDGALTCVPILLDDEKLDGLIEEIPKQEGPRPTIIAAGNVSLASVNERRRRLNISGLRKLSRLCEGVDMPFSFYDTAYPAGTTAGRFKGDACNAGTLEYQWRMRELGLVPVDRAILSCDADVERMHRTYMADMQSDFDESGTPVWIGAPNVLHEPLGDEFPRINYLLKWYDERLVHGRTPTHFGFNMAAYAAVGGLDPADAFGEAEGFYKRLVSQFGEGSITETFTDYPITVSSRHLVDRMVNGADSVEYEALHVPDSSAGESYRHTAPTEDISMDRMRKLLLSLVAERYVSRETQYLAQLGTDRVHASQEAREHAGFYAASKVLTIHGLVGALEESEAIVNDMLMVALRRSIKAPEPASF